jgi:hypothetical protein
VIKILTMGRGQRSAIQYLANIPLKQMVMTTSLGLASELGPFYLYASVRKVIYHPRSAPPMVAIDLYCLLENPLARRIFGCDAAVRRSLGDSRTRSGMLYIEVVSSESFRFLGCLPNLSSLVVKLNSSSVQREPRLAMTLSQFLKVSCFRI